MFAIAQCRGPAQGALCRSESTAAGDGIGSSAGATGELADESLDFQRGSNDSCQNRGAYLGHEHRVGQLR